MRELLPEQVTHLILHCSDSPWGDEQVISEWHRLRGFDPVKRLDGGTTWTGYHFVILNGFRSYVQLKDGHRVESDDGLVQLGRDERAWGCHAVGFNQRSLGICLIGINAFTPAQFRAAVALVRRLSAKYRIPGENVLGHCETGEFARGKSCPNFSMKDFRARVAQQELPYVRP